MSSFKGFPGGKVHLTSVPAPFFSELLPEIDNLAELKLTIYFFWRLEQMEGPFRYLYRRDLVTDEQLMRGLASSEEGAAAALEKALERAVQRGTLLIARTDPDKSELDCFFLNSPRGRAALRAIQSGKWNPQAETQARAEETAEAPNIFQLYEQNIGALTPLLAEALGEAEDNYPAQWIEEAFRIAVENNKRSWRYVSAILERWQREGYHGRKEKPEDRQDSPEARRRYIEGEYSEFIEH